MLVLLLALGWLTASVVAAVLFASLAGGGPPDGRQVVERQPQRH